MKKIIPLLLAFMLAGCAAPCRDAACQAQRDRAGADWARAIGDMANTHAQQRAENARQMQAIQQQQYDNAMRQQAIDAQNRQNNSYIQQGKCYNDQAGYQRCY